MGVGFMVVLILGIVAALAGDGTAALAAGAVGVAGAAMSAFIGATYIKAQSMASEQLKQFFVQPVEFARLLAAERLLGKEMDDSVRAAAITILIQGLARPPSAEDQLRNRGVNGDG